MGIYIYYIFICIFTYIYIWNAAGSWNIVGIYTWQTTMGILLVAIKCKYMWLVHGMVTMHWAYHNTNQMIIGSIQVWWVTLC